MEGGYGWIRQQVRDFVGEQSLSLYGCIIRSESIRAGLIVFSWNAGDYINQNESKKGPIVNKG